MIKVNDYLHINPTQVSCLSIITGSDNRTLALEIEMSNGKVHRINHDGWTSVYDIRKNIINAIERSDPKADLTV